jgi:hypothetical protein
MRTIRQVIIGGLCAVMVAAAAAAAEPAVPTDAAAPAAPTAPTAPTDAAAPAVPTDAAAVAPVVRIGMVPTRAQVGQGASATDLSNTVRDALITFMSGPNVQFVPLQSRIQIQVDAEAKQAGCDFIVFTSLTETKAQKTNLKGLAALMSAAAPLAALVPGAGNATATYAAQAAANAAQTVAAQQAQEDEQAASSVAAQGLAGKDDVMSLEYKIARTGDKTPLETKTLSVTATQDGEDIISPLVEQAANEILGALPN